MQPSASRRPRALLTLVLCSGLILASAAAAFAARAASVPSYVKRGSIHSLEEKGYLYTFDAMWRVENLRRIDPATQIATPAHDPARLDRLRAALLRRLKVEGLEGIPAEGREFLDQVRALGYL